MFKIIFLMALICQNLLWSQEYTPRLTQALENYQTTVLPNLERAQEVFKQLPDRSKLINQCFNRAHAWSRIMDKDFGIKSQKILIYYTERYRKDVDRKWWFHIAPTVLVNQEGYEELYVMDVTFTSRPMLISEWEANFTGKLEKKTGVRNYRCKEISNISEYYDERNQRREFCNIQHVSMYYWEPNNLEALENEGLQVTRWRNNELEIAFKDAWRNWRELIQRYRVW